MKREDQTVIQCKQPIKLEKPLQCLRYSLIKSSVKKNHAAIFKAQVMAENTTKTQGPRRGRGW